MNLTILTVFLTLLPLGWVFYVLWKARKNFHSLTPFIMGAIFIAIARWLDVPIEVPSLNAAGRLGLSVASINSIIIMLGDLTDIVGVMFLVFGFIRTIGYLQTTEKKIVTLEALLPICAWCKKIRSNDGAWKSIEKYLEQSGAPPITHGICPECSMKMLENHKRNKNSRSDVS